VTVILLNLVVTDQIKFVRKFNQLNVTLTKTRENLIIIMNIYVNKMKHIKYK